MKSAYLPFVFFCIYASLFSGVNADRLDLGDQADEPQGGVDPQMDENMALEAQRLMLWGCYFFTKNLLYSKADEINQLLAALPNKEVVNQKIISDLMIDCLTKASPYDLQELVQGYGGQEFNIAKWDNLHTYSRGKYENLENFAGLSEQEIIPFQYYEQIEQIIQEHIAKTGGVGPDGQPQYAGREELTLFGIPLETISFVMKIVFVISLVSLIALIIYHKFFQPATIPVPTEKKEGKDEKPKKKESKEGKEVKEEKKQKEEKKEKKEAKEEQEIVKEKDAKKKKDE